MRKLESVAWIGVRWTNRHCTASFAADLTQDIVILWLIEGMRILASLLISWRYIICVQIVCDSLVMHCYYLQLIAKYGVIPPENRMMVMALFFMGLVLVFPWRIWSHPLCLKQTASWSESLSSEHPTSTNPTMKIKEIVISHSMEGMIPCFAISIK